MPFVRCGVYRRVMIMTTRVEQCLNSISYFKIRGSDLKEVTAHKAFAHFYRMVGTMSSSATRLTSRLRFRARCWPSPGRDVLANVSTAAGCMRSVDFANLTGSATHVNGIYCYQFQPRVDGDFVADTYESQVSQGRFNWDEPLVIAHELHESNGSPTSGVNTTTDVEVGLHVFFPAITEDIIQEIMEPFPESDYTSHGLPLC